MKNTLHKQSISYTEIEQLVRKICISYSHSMPYEDKESAAWSGLFYALNTYNPGLYVYEEYIILCINQAIDIERKRRNRRYKIESKLSIDGYSCNEESDNPTSNYVAQRNEFLEDYIILHDFISKLNPKEQLAVYLLINKSTFNDLIELQKISSDECILMINNIKSELLKYYGEQYIKSII